MVNQTGCLRIGIGLGDSSATAEARWDWSRATHVTICCSKGCAVERLRRQSPCTGPRLVDRLIKLETETTATLGGAALIGSGHGFELGLRPRQRPASCGAHESVMPEYVVCASVFQTGCSAGADRDALLFWIDVATSLGMLV